MGGKKHLSGFFVFLVMLLVVLIPQPVLGVSEWWGNVTIISGSTTNSSTDGAVVVALADNISITHDIVGTPDSTYYLIHVTCDTWQTIKFQVYGVNASPTNLTGKSCSAGSHDQLDLTVHLVATGAVCPSSYAEQPGSGNIHNGCVGGYCVHDICRAAATYCGDSQCDTGETCTTCSGDCGACATTSTGSGSSSSGGGGTTTTPTTEPEEEEEEEEEEKDVEEKQQLPLVEAGKEAKIAFTKTELLVTGISIAAENTIQVGDVTVRKTAEKPFIVTTPPDNVYNYIVVTSDVNDVDVKSVTISFRVEKLWLTSNGIDKSTIMLNRYEGGWKAYAPKEIGETSTHILFEATLPGLSVFAITGKKKIPITGEIVQKVCSPGATKCIDENKMGVCKQDGSGYDDVECTLGCENGACKSMAPAFVTISMEAGLTATLVIIVVVLIAAYFYTRKGRKKKRNFKYDFR